MYLLKCSKSGEKLGGWIGNLTRENEWVSERSTETLQQTICLVALLSPYGAIEIEQRRNNALSYSSSSIFGYMLFDYVENCIQIAPQSTSYCLS